MVRGLINKYFCFEPCPNCGKENWHLVSKLEYNPHTGMYDIHLIQCLDCMFIVEERCE